jgi:hypothetical protein
MQIASVGTLLGQTPDAVPVSVYSQEPPYWVNLLTALDVQLNSQDQQIVTYHITGTLVLAKITQGFEQEAEKLIQLVIPPVLIYFGKRRQMRRTVSDSPLVELDPRGLWISSGQPDYSIPGSGVGATNFGMGFNYEIPVVEETEVAFW